MAKRLRGIGPLSPAYERRLERAAEKYDINLETDRSAARGHGVITKIKEIKGTTFVEIIKGKPKRSDIERIIKQQSEKGFDTARIIRGKLGQAKTTGWFDIEDFDNIDDLSDDADPYANEGYSGVYSIAFVVI